MKAIVSTIVTLPGLHAQRMAIYQNNQGTYLVAATISVTDKPPAYIGTDYRAAQRAYQAEIDRMLGADL